MLRTTDFPENSIDSFAVLTGDSNANSEWLLRSQLALNLEFFSDLRPEDKQTMVLGFKEKYSVIFVGDGMNDLLAMAEADLNISIHSNGLSATQTSDIAIEPSNLTKLPDILNIFLGRNYGLELHSS